MRTVGGVEELREARRAGGSRRERLWLGGWIAFLAGGLMVYSQTLAFTWDEGFHLLAAQLIRAGKRPYLDFCFPQTPFNAYWTAGWMSLFGETWRVTHVVSALLASASVALAAQYVFSRVPVARWRLAAGCAAAALAGMNWLVFDFGSVGQAYGLCLFALVAAFRVTLAAADRRSPAPAALAGLLAGAAAASSLLTAAAAPVLLAWLALRSRAGARWAKAAAYLAGATAPFLPVLWLFAHGPRQTLFNLFQYQMRYRAINWPETTRHDLEVLTSWIDCGQALVMLALAAAGVWFLRSRKEWGGAWRSELALCGWLALALGAEVGVAHPTFPRYFVVAIPFVAILAAVGFHGFLSGGGGALRSLWAAAVLSLFLALALGKSMYEDRDTYRWADMELLARKVAEIAPPGVALVADEPIYFLMRRTPLPGQEFAYAHTVTDLSKDRAAELHVVSYTEMKKQAHAGAYAVFQTCDDDHPDITALDLKPAFRQRVEVSECAVYSGPTGK
jgi:hypothetical protein